MSELAVGAVLGGVRIDAVTGSGGMGVVYRGLQLALKRTVALKVVRDDLAGNPEFRRRFTQESEIAASLDHPHIVPIHAAGEEDGRLYVIMRHVEGTDLRELLKRTGRLDPAAVVGIVTQIGAALDAAHRRGLVHRDVKPANILMAAADAHPHAYLTDFGLSRLADSDGFTKAGTVVGTLDYMAPEQFEGGHVDGRVDVYALGCVLYQALTGRVPFPRDTEHAKMWAHMTEPPPRLAEVAPELPPGLDRVVQIAMAKGPQDRYATAGELGLAAAVALAAQQASGSVTPNWLAAPPPAATQTTPAPPQAAPPTAVGPQWGQGQPYPPPYPPAYQQTYQRSYPQSYPSHPSGPLPGPPHSGPAPRRRSRVGLVLAIVAVLVAATAGTGAYLLLRETGVTPDPPVTVAGTVEGQPIATGTEPYDVEVGEGYVWTTNLGDGGSISKIDPKTDVAQQIPVGGVPLALVVAEGAAWVWNYSDAIVRVDAATGAVSESISSGAGEINGITAGGGYIWLSHSTADAVTRIDPKTLAQAGDPIAVGGGPVALAYGKRSLYVVGSTDRTITVVDGATATVQGAPITLADDLGGIEVKDGVIYVGSTGDITPIDEASFAVGAPIPLQGGSYFGADTGGVWAAFPLENRVRWFDLTGKESRGGAVEGVGRGVTDVVPDGAGSLWVSNTEANTIQRVRIT